MQRPLSTWIRSDCAGEAPFETARSLTLGAHTMTVVISTTESVF
jgi:hypothetical protein